MADIIKEAKKLVKKAKKNVDMAKIKKDAKKAGEIVKDGKITDQEKKELANMAKELMKDFNDLKK